MDVPRIKLVFDREIQKRKKDAQPSMTLVDRIKNPRISDFCQHIIHLFDLTDVCPQGITISIEGDLIHPSESTHVLRENDIVRVGIQPGIVPGVKNEHDQIEGQEE